MLKSKVCKACQEEERMRLPSGQLSALCEGCYRDTQENERAALPQRLCKNCDERKPITDFPKNGEHRKWTCKACYSSMVAAAKRGEPQHTLTPDATRTCAGCKETKPLSEFRKQGNYHQAICKPCYELRNAEIERRKAEGLPALPRVQFKGKAPMPNAFEGQPTTPHVPLSPGVLLVDRERRHVIICTIVNEATLGPLSIDSAIDFYRSRGHRIIEVVETTEGIHERAI